MTAGLCIDSTVLKHQHWYGVCLVDSVCGGSAYPWLSSSQMPCLRTQSFRLFSVPHILCYTQSLLRSYLLSVWCCVGIASLLQCNILFVRSLSCQIHLDLGWKVPLGVERSYVSGGCLPYCRFCHHCRCDTTLADVPCEVPQCFGAPRWE